MIIPAAPTYAELILIDQVTKRATFNPIWLQWFIQLSAIQNTPGSVLAGGTAGTIQYNNAGVLGGFAASGDATINTSTGVVTVSKLNNVAVTWNTWVPTRTGWTDVGSPTVTARYSQIGKTIFFSVKVVPATSVATVAGTSYISLPVAMAGSTIGGDGSMENITSLVAVGNCVFDAANSRCYVPAQIASGNSFTINGWYEAA